MNDTLLFTFKSFKYEDQLNVGVDFTFDKVKRDIELFEKLIEERKPKLIIGIAKGRLRSRFEIKAVNIFNGSKKVDREGVDKYALDYPRGGYESIGVNRRFTDSYCNWVIYKISQMIEGTDTKLQFVHLIRRDLDIFNEYLGTIDGHPTLAKLNNLY